MSITLSSLLKDTLDSLYKVTLFCIPIVLTPCEFADNIIYGSM